MDHIGRLAALRIRVLRIAKDLQALHDDNTQAYEGWVLTMSIGMLEDLAQILQNELDRLENEA